MDFDKYNPMKNINDHEGKGTKEKSAKETHGNELNHWSKSESVSRLRQYLIDVKDYGIELIESDGITIRFNPPIRKNEEDRMILGDTAVELVIEAKEDLDILRKRGAITLKRRGSFL